jgi:hypothetical protein
MSDTLIDVPLNENSDPMGRPQRRNNGILEQYAPNLQLWELIDNSNPIWFDNYQQFARLLAEIIAVGLTKNQWDSLLLSMDLHSDQLSDLFDRAQDVWERDKQLTFGDIEPRWKIYHEFDHETTCVSTGDSEEDEQNDIVFEATIPVHLRLHFARMLVSALNTDARTGPKGLQGVYSRNGMDSSKRVIPNTESKEG